VTGDLVVFARDYPPEPQLFAVSRSDGKLVWKVALVKLGKPGPSTSHSTPAIWRDQVVLHRPGEVSAYSLKDGSRRWWVNVTTQGTSTPLATPDAVYVTAFSIVGEPEGIPDYAPFSALLEKYDRNKDGKLSRDELPDNDVFLVKRVGVPDNVPGAHFTLKLFFRVVDRNGDGFVDEQEWKAVPAFVKFINTTDFGLTAIRPGGEGDVTASAVLWREQRSVPEVPSPLYYHGKVCMVANGGILSCVDAKTGKMLFRGRVGAPGAYYASPVAAGSKLFLASAEGVVTVAGDGDTLTVLSNNDLGEPIFGTPALVGSSVYIRSAHHLWAFGNR
jgi:outer membrane protein assembly factor BamB